MYESTNLCTEVQIIYESKNLFTKVQFCVRKYKLVYEIRWNLYLLFTKSIIYHLKINFLKMAELKEMYDYLFV